MSLEKSNMKKASIGGMLSVLALGITSQAFADSFDDDGFDSKDFGVKVERLLSSFSEPLFGIERPLKESALGPFAGPNRDAIVVAHGLKVSVVSNATHPNADMIALWPNDEHPTHLFVCVEVSGSVPTDVISVQRVNLAGNPDNNAETIVKGLSACDPIRRTPWGTLVVAEEAGATGGLYEILDPLGISAANPVVVLNRAAGTTTDPARVVKRKAVGSLSWEGNAILPNGTMYFGDELRPTNGALGGAIYKFVPTTPFNPANGHITDLGQSPFVAGSLYGLRVGTPTDFGQGTEIGRGSWISINAPAFTDANGNVILRNAQTALKFTGYYRPEDMERDPIAAAAGITRLCWAATGRVSSGDGSAIGEAATWGEIMCLVDDAVPAAASGASPVVSRFIANNPDFSMPDNLAFQPHTGNLVVLEDGEVETFNPDGTLKELRGNDIWMCLPDGADHDVQSDGCVRIASLKDTNSEPTGFIFDASGENAYVNMQHRVTGQGALLKISGFKVRK
jgi:hypothetical protein